MCAYSISSLSKWSYLRVSSTVQTDYEWHEFIEGVVIFDRGAVTARIIANNQELVSRQFPDEETV